MKSKIITYFVFGITCLYSFQVISQTPQINLEKYWVYRERLKNFVVVGDCQGCSLPAASRSGNGNGKPNALQWDDETCRLGTYIGFLATEYKLLKDNNQTVFLNQTRKELYYALEAFNRIDNWAEYYWRINQNLPATPPQKGDADLNGFFIRDDINFNFFNTIYNGNLIENQLNNSLVPLGDSYKALYTNSGYAAGILCGDGPKEESLDQVIELLVGFALVVKCVDPTDTYNGAPFSDGETHFFAETKKIVDRIMQYISGSGWRIPNPITGQCVQGVTCSSDPAHFTDRSCAFGSKGGGNLDGLGWGFFQTYYEIFSGFTSNHGCSCTGLSMPSDQWAFENATSNGYANSLNTQLDKYVKLYALGNTFGNQTMSTITSLAHDASYIYHVPLIYQILYGTSNIIPNSVFECMLNSAPCRGNLVNGNYEWGQADRILYGPNIHGWNESDNAIFGIDYMLYFNLYNLCNPSYMSSIGGFTYIDPKQLALVDITKTNHVESDEKNFIASHNITAGNFGAGDYRIAYNNDPLQAIPYAYPNVTFNAANDIQLMPGFSVESPSSFSAFPDRKIASGSCSSDPASMACSACNPTGGSEYTNTTNYGNYKVYPISSTLMYVATPHQLFKISNAGGGGENMFNISLYGTIYGNSGGPGYMLGYQDFSGYTNSLGDAPNITDVEYIVNNGQSYTLISFDDGSMVKCAGTGGSGDNMFCLQKNHGNQSPCTNGIFCSGCGSGGYFLGTQKFNGSITQTEYVNGILFVCINNSGLGDILVIDCSNGIGGTGDNMFNVVQKPTSNSEAFDNGSSTYYNGYYRGDQRFSHPATFLTHDAYADRLIIGFSDGKILKNVGIGGSGHYCFDVNETSTHFTDACSSCPEYEGDDYVPNYGINGYLVNYVPLVFSGQAEQSLLFFSDGSILKAEYPAGGMGNNMLTNHTLGSNKGTYALNQSLTSYYLDNTTNKLVMGFSDGRLLVETMQLYPAQTGQNFLAITEATNGFDNATGYSYVTGSSNFGSAITDIKLVNGYYFLSLANGKIIKLNSLGSSGKNIFGLNYTNPCFEAICGFPYYVGCQNFEGINAFKQASSASTGVKQLSSGNRDQMHVNIFPNPSTGNFVVETDQQMLLQMFDATGKEVLTQTVDVRTSIDATYLKEGVYNIKMSDDKNIINKRIVIAR